MLPKKNNSAMLPITQICLFSRLPPSLFVLTYTTNKKFTTIIPQNAESTPINCKIRFVKTINLNANLIFLLFDLDGKCNRGLCTQKIEGI